MSVASGASTLPVRSCETTRITTGWECSCNWDWSNSLFDLRRGERYAQVDPHQDGVVGHGSVGLRGACGRRDAERRQGLLRPEGVLPDPAPRAWAGQVPFRRDVWS